MQEARDGTTAPRRGSTCMSPGGEAHPGRAQGMRLEFRIPISPNPGFYSQVRLFACSLARMEPPYSTARIQVSVGDHASPADVCAANAWADAYPVDWYVVPDAMYHRAPADPWVSGLGRYLQPSDADVVILCDADTCVVDRFDELLEQLDDDAPIVAGLQAHYPPFPDNDGTWRRLLDAAGAGDMVASIPYSMDVGSTRGHAPPYFNYGFVAMNAAAFARMALAMPGCLHRACELMPQNPMAAQVALTLGLFATGSRVLPLGHEYNCANDDLLLAHGLVDPGRVKVIHYLRANELDRRAFVADPEAFAAFIAVPHRNAINERLRRHLFALGDRLFDATPA
jgi:hypothetical protein